MVALGLALGASIAWGGSDFLAGLVARRLPVLTLLVLSHPVTTVALAAIVLRKRPRALQGLGVVGALVGIGLVSAPGGPSAGSPARAVALHDPVAARQLRAVGQRAGEGLEGLAVVSGDEQQVVAAHALRLGRELQVASGVEAIAEDDGSDLARLAIDPHGALAAPRRVVDPGHEVPDDRLAARRDAGAGAPLPRGMARVVAGRLVDQAARIDPERAALQRDEPGGADRRLARPDVGGAVAADDLDRLTRRLEDQIDGDLAVGHANGAVGQGHAAAAQGGALPQALALAVPDRPEGLRDPRDVDGARAHHHLGPVDAHVAPALERPATAPARQRPGGQGEPRGADSAIAPVGQRVEHAGYALRD